MIHTTVGMPNRFSEWCETILKKLLIEAGGDPACFVADLLDHIGREVLVARQPDALVTCRMASKPVADALIAAKRPFLVTLDTPENSVRCLVGDYKLSFPDAVRRAARSLTAILPLTKCTHALVLDGTSGITAQAAADKMAGHFDLKLDDAGIDNALKGIPEQPAEMEADLDSLLSPLDKREMESRAATASKYGFRTEAGTAADIVRGATDSLWSAFKGGPVKDVRWHPLLLILGDCAPKPPIAALDLTGSQRCLVYGPFISLPRGSWTCRFFLNCEERAVGANLRAEVFVGSLLCAAEFVIRGSGITEVELSFVSPGVDAPIEIRLFKDDKTCEGALVMGEVALHPRTAKVTNTTGLSESWSTFG